MLKLGSRAAVLIAQRANLPVELVRELGTSGGESLAHFDGNDTGAGRSTSVWGKQQVEAAGFTYKFGDEGLPDGRHTGERLLHMVMIISKHCSMGEGPGEPPPPVTRNPCHL